MKYGDCSFLSLMHTRAVIKRFASCEEEKKVLWCIDLECDHEHLLCPGTRLNIHALRAHLR